MEQVTTTASEQSPITSPAAETVGQWTAEQFLVVLMQAIANQYGGRVPVKTYAEAIRMLGLIQAVQRSDFPQYERLDHELFASAQRTAPGY